MILELRDLSDTRPDKQADQQRPIALDSLVWAIANEWRQVAQAQNLSFHVLIEKPGQYILGQERRLRWAVGNVIDNAIKYTPAGGDLTLEIQEADSDDFAHLRVRDNGVGIARQELPHVMTRFYRGRPVTAEGQPIRVPGSGQGLYLANQIFEAHGGAIEIKSKVDVGTAVYFTLPLTAEQSYELPRLMAQFEGETLPLQLDHPDHDPQD
jgi:signal transduction histidine kinase